MGHFDPRNSVALVTAAGRQRGIGRAIVEALLNGGARRVYATVRDPAQARLLGELGRDRVTVLELDVTDPLGAARVVAAAPDVQLLVNNAGAYTTNPALGDEARARAEMEVNLWGPLRLARAFALVLGQNGGGAIVNINSIASFVSFPLGATYSASKAAAHSITQALRRELAGQGTLVMGVYPGPIDTDMARDVPMEKSAPRVVAEAVLAALHEGREDVFPDETARTMYDRVLKEGKVLERELMAMTM